MTKNIATIILLIAILLLGVFIYVYTNYSRQETKNDILPPVVVDDPITGCYIAVTENDRYILNIRSMEGENVTGDLEFKNFQKDSSSGTFTGTYKNGILFGDYAFYSEGMYSVMQVIFKKSGNDFIRGYGEVNSEGTSFVDLSKITYNASSTLSLFINEECPAQ